MDAVEELRREEHRIRSEEGRRRADERRRKKARKWKWLGIACLILLFLPGGLALIGLVLSFAAIGYGFYLGGKVQPGHRRRGEDPLTLRAFMRRL